MGRLLAALGRDGSASTAVVQDCSGATLSLVMRLRPKDGDETRVGVEGIPTAWTEPE